MNIQPTKIRLQQGQRRTLALLLACALLSACGGGSGGGGTTGAPAAASPASTPRAPPAAPAPAAQSLQEQITAMESSGAYPKLDRSVDVPGPDANGNGVRDDIETWVNAQPVAASQKKALLQTAKSLQRTLIVALDDKKALQTAGEGLASSSQCGMLQFPEYSDFSKYAGKIEAMTANTRQRAERYMKYNAARSGSSTTSPNGDTCEP